MDGPLDRGSIGVRPLVPWSFASAPAYYMITKESYRSYSCTPRRFRQFGRPCRGTTGMRLAGAATRGSSSDRVLYSGSRIQVALRHRLVASTPLVQRRDLGLAELGHEQAGLVIGGVPHLDESLAYDR